MRLAQKKAGEERILRDIEAQIDERLKHYEWQLEHLKVERKDRTLPERLASIVEQKIVVPYYEGKIEELKKKRKELG